MNLGWLIDGTPDPVHVHENKRATEPGVGCIPSRPVLIRPSPSHRGYLSPRASHWTGAWSVCPTRNARGKTSCEVPAFGHVNIRRKMTHQLCWGNSPWADTCLGWFVDLPWWRTLLAHLGSYDYASSIFSHLLTHGSAELRRRCLGPSVVLPLMPQPVP